MDSASPNPAAPAPVAASPIDPATALKRKRSPSISSTNATPIASVLPVAKAPKTSNQLSINYLARQLHEDLPLINKDDTLPNLLSLLSSYTSILDRHESLASNLGARPLGPILIKRFERCFDAPPKIVASHHKGAASNPDDTTHNITWLEVIEFARSHPAQFTLSTFSEGRRVCQFYYPQKQLRVQISEEDFLFINSGRCQELIPPLPIWEDEEKEVGTCDVLEAKLKELTNAADMVAARTRQLGHRLKGRRSAILERRAEGGSGTPAKANALQTTTAPPSNAAAAFTAVNGQNGRTNGDLPEPSLGSSTAVKNDLLRHFEGLPQNQTQGRSQSRQSLAPPQDSFATSHRPSEVPNPAHIEHHDPNGSNASSMSPIPNNLYTNDASYYNDLHRPASTVAPANHRPSSSNTANPSNAPSYNPVKHNFSRPLPPALESSQPFRPLCQGHMDSLPRGQRVMPPCDRCRRLRMDCVKNLTSCAGCTRKHARCHWRDVTREELGTLDMSMEGSYTLGDDGDGYGYTNGHDESDDDDDSNPLEDLEALEEQEEGLRNARELSRLGWEEGIKSNVTSSGEGQAEQQRATVNGESAEKAIRSGSPQGVSPRTHQHSVAATTAVGVEKQASAISIDLQRLDATNTSPGAAKFASPIAAAPPATQEDYRPSFGGFRAVNGGTATGSIGGWRE
jgi:hypothetical protein